MTCSLRLNVSVNVRTGSQIDLAEWDSIIDQEPWLEQLEDKSCENPFTGETLQVPGAGRAYFIKDGNRVGSVALEGGELLTTQVPIEACEEIARKLEATVQADDRS